MSILFHFIWHIGQFLIQLPKYGLNHDKILNAQIGKASITATAAEES
jgi:hypothetical protein